LILWNGDRKTAVINVFLQIVQALLPVVSLYFIKELIESLMKEERQFNEILLLIIAFGSVQFILTLATQYSVFINTIHQQTITDYLSNKVLNKAISVDYPYYENPKYHDTLHLAQQQSLHKATLLLNNFNSLLVNSLSLVFLVIFFLSLNSLFALLFITLSIPLAIIKWYSGFELMRLERKFAPMEREANYLHQTLTGVSYAKEVRVFGFGSTFINKFNTIRQYIHTEKKHLHKKLTYFSLIAQSLEIIAMTFIFGLLAKYTFENTLTIAVFVIYIQGFQRLQGTSKNFLQSLVQIFQQRNFLKDLFAFFDTRVSKENQNAITFPEGKLGLSVKNISFKYPQTNKVVLNNVSLNCSPGKIIAIVGENGSGKSTLIKLLARLYKLESGMIEINENQIKDISTEDFRAHSMFLFQDFEKYFFSIEENIALGEDKKIKTDEAIENAAILSGAHDFISKLSKGYKTRMGRLFQGSEQISGGQWQKLALARIFYKDTKLVVLDEPTSALDATAEFELFKNIKDELKDKMVILVTHRLYNLKIADHVYVMQEGKIAEEGSFESLINKGGVFTNMYQAQKL
jgi:ATP-binding cassette subfamily B protein